MGTLLSYNGSKGRLNVAETRTIDGEDYHILLSKRFDRNGDGKRIHFASTLTLLGLTDGDNSSTGYGYSDIVDFIIQHGSNVEQNLDELYRRVAFYIIIGNSDDHFRNHGFLLTRKGWELSPHTTSTPHSPIIRACLSIAPQANLTSISYWHPPEIICFHMTKPRALSPR